MAGSVVVQELEILGKFIKNLGDGERTDAGYDGEINIYWDTVNLVVRMQVYSATKEGWEAFDPAAMLAPDDAAYLIKTVDSSLVNAEIVGLTPQGELAGTWASPTVDTVHAEGAHSTMIETHRALATAHHSNASDHLQSHTETDHSDATATVAELDELTNGSETVLHTHSTPGVTTVEKTAYESVTSSTTFQSDDELSVSIANTAYNYEISGVISFASTNVADMKFQWEGVAGSFAGIGMYLNTSGSWVVGDWNTLGSGTDPLVVGGNAATPNHWKQTMAFFGVFNPSATGTLNLQWAQNTSEAVQTGVYAGSILSHREVV